MGIKETADLSSSVTPNQLRAARALVRWSMQDLSEHSGVPSDTINGFESRGAQSKPETLAKLMKALKSAGIEFIEPDEKGGPGVRLKIAKATKGKR